MPARRASNCASTFMASRAVVVFGTVGPDAITSSGSPSTSEMISVTSCPAAHARANPPPLTRLSCLRTVLSCSMSAPAPLKCRVTACLSASEIPSTGAGNNADPPPEIRQMQRSFGESDRTICRICSVPLTASSVGSFTPGGRAPCR